MPLVEEFESVGHWLFRWRTYLPLVIFVLVLGGLQGFNYPYGSHLLDQFWEVFCLGISLSGTLIRCITVGCAAHHSSGRQTVQQVADELNTTGMYSIVRNPLYLGNFLMILGVVLFLRSWWSTLIYILVFALYYERIIFAEEQFLRRKFAGAYVDWASQTPAFFPRFSQWRSPALPFNWKKALRREYHGVTAAVMCMFFLEIAGDSFAGNEFEIDNLWRIVLPVTLGSYATIRFLHKRTHVFEEATNTDQ